MNRLYFLLFILFSTAASSQVTISIPASKDNTIYSEGNNSNGAGENFFAGTTNNGSLRRALIQFNLSSLPAGATIQSVTLTLNMNKTISGNQTVSLFKLNANWGEGSSDAASNEGAGTAAAFGDATWNYSFYNTTAWTAGGSYNPSPSAATSVGALGNYSWSSSQMLADVQGWASNPATNFGWIIIGNEGTLQSAKRFASRENPVSAARPQLTISYLSALPVRFLSFDGKTDGANIDLQWQTASEQNNHYFQVEHSIDGVIFKAVGRLNGAGNSSEKRTYNFRHTEAMPGKNFYRLVQTDFDGRQHLSNTIRIDLNNAGRISVFPNPAGSRLYLEGFISEGQWLYKILSSAGTVLRSGNLVANEISLEGIPPGLYFLNVLNGNRQVFWSRFVRQ